MSLKASALHGAFPPFQTQSVEQSPTATPHHTRAGTPIHEKLLDRSGSETKETMAALNALMKPSYGTHEEMELTRVSLVDGSADVSVATKLNYLMIYLVLNLGLTLYNKAVMIQVCATPGFQGPIDGFHDPCLVRGCGIGSHISRSESAHALCYRMSDGSGSFRLIYDGPVPLSLPTYRFTRLRGMYWNYGLGLKRGLHRQATDQQRVRDIAGLLTALHS